VHRRGGGGNLQHGSFSSFLRWAPTRPSCSRRVLVWPPKPRALGRILCAHPVVPSERPGISVPAISPESEHGTRRRAPGSVRAEARRGWLRRRARSLRAGAVYPRQGGPDADWSLSGRLERISTSKGRPRRSSGHAGEQSGCGCPGTEARTEERKMQAGEASASGCSPRCSPRGPTRGRAVLTLSQEAAGGARRPQCCPVVGMRSSEPLP